jgi:hypothetical protein
MALKARILNFIYLSIRTKLNRPSQKQTAEPRKVFRRELYDSVFR